MRFLLLTLFLLPTLCPAEVLTGPGSGLVLRYEFEANNPYAETSGSTNRDVNGATYALTPVSYVPALLPPYMKGTGCAGGFGVVGSYLRLSSTALNFIYNKQTDFTITTITNLNPTTQTVQYLFYARRGSSDNLTIRFENGLVYFQGVSNSVTTVINNAIPVGPLKNMFWAFVNSKTQGLLLYKNGILINQNVTVQNIFDYASAGIFIGAISSGAFPYYGFFDSLRIYNRALSPAEVAALYREGTRARRMQGLRKVSR
jgi:hypothetical protein